MDIIKISSKKAVDNLEKLSEEEVLKILETNPRRIAEIRSDKRTLEMCKVVVKHAYQGKLLKYIPKKMWNEELYFSIAVFNARYITCHVPKYIKTEDFFKRVLDYKIKNNIFEVSFFGFWDDLYFKDAALFFEAPEKLLTRELYLKVVKCNGALLRFVPEKFRDYEMCDTALRNSIHAIRFLPSRFFSDEFIERMISCHGLFLKFIPEDKITIDTCCKAIQNDIRAKRYIPESLITSKTIIDELNAVEKKLNAKIESSQDDDFYNRTIVRTRDFIDETELSSSTNEIVSSDGKRKVTIGRKRENQFKVYYITDLHLNHKLLKRFPTPVAKSEIVTYIRELIQEMLKDVEIYFNNYLLIGGDVSFCFEISEIFYRTLIEFVNPKNIVAVLGNHELWDFNRFGIKSNRAKSIQDIVGQYRELFKSIGINFLHNDLLVANFDIRECREQKKEEISIYSRERLLKMSDSTIRELCKKSGFIVLGGLGFSGYNEEYNAERGLYRQAVKDKNEDLRQTQHFEELYLKLSQSLVDKNVIVLSHTPKENWTKSPYIKDWVYISGHTHNNRYLCNANQKVYQDNQMGYHWETLKLKYIAMGRYFNIFHFLADGIYEISRKEYLEFNYGIGVHCEFNRVDGNLFMCKNKGYYMFFVQNQRLKTLYLLEGGKLNRLKINNVEYYYNNMSNFCSAIKKSTSKYFKALERLSKNIQMIGGDGEIHGSIVDIDFYNHIYLNPNDGTIHAYYSPEFGAEIKYKGVIELLKAQCPDLYANYKRLSKKSNELILAKNNVDDITISHDTSFYQQSEIVKKMQYITKNNVIRLWNDEILDIIKLKGEMNKKGQKLLNE